MAEYLLYPLASGPHRVAKALQQAVDEKIAYAGQLGAGAGNAKHALNPSQDVIENTCNCVLNRGHCPFEAAYQPVQQVFPYPGPVHILEALNELADDLRGLCQQLPGVFHQGGGQFADHLNGGGGQLGQRPFRQQPVHQSPQHISGSIHEARGVLGQKFPQLGHQCSRRAADGLGVFRHGGQRPVQELHGRAAEGVHQGRQRLGHNAYDLVDCPAEGLRVLADQGGNALDALHQLPGHPVADGLDVLRLEAVGQGGTDVRHHLGELLGCLARNGQKIRLDLPLHACKGVGEVVVLDLTHGAQGVGSGGGIGEHALKNGQGGGPQILVLGAEQGHRRLVSGQRVLHVQQRLHRLLKGRPGAVASLGHGAGHFLGVKADILERLGGGVAAVNGADGELLHRVAHLVDGKHALVRAGDEGLHHLFRR